MKRPNLLSSSSSDPTQWMPKTVWVWFFALAIVGSELAGERLLAQSSYSLPNDNNSCPADCRQIPWKGGSDLWNHGKLPAYTQDPTCTGLVADGSTDNTTAINSCIANAAAGHAVYIPAGVYYVAGTINMKSQVVLRGAKPSASPFLPTADTSATTLKFGKSGQVSFGGSYSSPASVSVTGSATKGMTTLTLSPGHGLAPNDWIMISESDDQNTSLVDQASCTWCGWKGSAPPYHLMVQVVQVTAVNGNDITISRPLYYTFAYSPVVGKMGAFSTTKSGLENMRLDGSAFDHTNYGGFILLRNSLYDWVSGVETYDAGSATKNFHVTLEWSYG